MDKIIRLLKMQKANYQIDSRLVKKNDIFFALKGEKTDGHDYLAEIANKARVAIVSLDYKPIKDMDLELIKVKDVLEFLHEVAKRSLVDCRAKRIGITGSMGKTTIKEFTAILLSGEFKVSKTIRSYNSQRALPIAVLNMDKNVDFLVLEMAMDEKYELEKLVKIAPLDIAMINRLVEYHENFNSIEDLAYAKKEIFSDKRTKIKLINKELKKLKAFKNEDFLTFSINDKKADFYLDIENKTFYEMGKKYKIFLPFLEKHFLEDLTASIAICRLLNEKYENIFRKFKELKSIEMRFEKVSINGILFIKDCYNANPISTMAALENMPITKGKKIAVLGSHLGIGKHSKMVHKKIIKEAKKKVDEILCLGEEWRHIKNVKKFSDIESLVRSLKKLMKKNDIVLVKGSRQLQMEKIFDFIN
jgi:UDP-N-acetylmuramoyl-tripeptide--D-alanyl-D-alanine ligase